MSLRRLIFRGLWHYRRTNLAVLFGLAVATAVITGSLIVGDSVTGSIRETALARLGKIDFAVSSRHFFREALAQYLNSAGPLDTIRQVGVHVPALLADGTVRNDDTGVTAAKVSLIGIDKDFSSLFPKTTLHLTIHEAAVNEALARDLGVHIDDAVIISIGKIIAISPDNLFADRKRAKVLGVMRLRVAAILPDRGVGGFSLSASTATPRNLFLPLDRLQAALGVERQVNLLLISPYRSIRGELLGTRTVDSVYNWLPSYIGYSTVRKTLRMFLTDMRQPADFGLTITFSPQQGYLAVQSEEMILSVDMVSAALKAARACKTEATTSSIYLATTISTAKPGVEYDMPQPSIAYSQVAAVEPRKPFTFRAGGGKAPSKDGIWLNTWAAEDLHARVGAPVTLEYLIPQPDGTYDTRRMSLNVEGIVQIAGSADDRRLMPPFKGITDTKSIDAWDPPFPIDMRRITPRDDEYWQRYRTTPKAFVNQETAKAMWRSGSTRTQTDWVTSVHVYPPRDVSLEVFKVEFIHALELPDFTLIELSKRAIESSRGTTDFAQLFLAMSFFLVLSAAGLAGMLMRLAVERRAAEAGIMAACGFGAGQVRRALWGEGLLLALGGMLLGVPLGLGYAAGIIYALGSWWVGAVGGATLWLHVTPGALIIGGISGLIVGLTAMASATWSLGKKPVLELLAGWRAAGVAPGKSARLLVSLILCGLLILAVLLVMLAIGGKAPEEGAFFGSGALLLCAGLCGGYLLLTRWLHTPLTFPTLARLAMRSAAANRGRSLLVMGLLAGAGFIIVAVAANVRDFSRLDVHRKDSGAGGFALRAISTVPLPVDISMPAGRKHLGFSTEDEALFRDVSIYPLLYSDGDDISCLNLAAAQQPSMVGISNAFIRRGGFSVIPEEDGSNPWMLLQSEKAVFGDADSVIWSLHSALDGKVTLTGSSEQRDGHLAGLLPGSIFAGELLISEANFRQLFPEITRPRYYLVETPRGKEEAVAEALRRNLGDFGLEVRSTRELLNAYAGVQNTYLSTFLALGGLGLMLGTLGLVIVLLRNALERRKEFALLLAQGFTERELAALLVIENAGLLAAGLLCGTVTALIAVAPHLSSVSARVNWVALIAVLAGILLVGLVSCLLAARAATYGKLLDALREE